MVRDVSTKHSCFHYSSWRRFLVDVTMELASETHFGMIVCNLTKIRHKLEEGTFSPDG